jgi:predicted MFS family arabinose efflux permease
VKFTSLFSKSPAINSLSSARLFLFASRDAWFVVGLPVFLSQLGWTSYSVGAFLALWVIGYGIVQAVVPDLLRALGNRSVDGSTAIEWVFGLAVIPAALAITLHFGMDRNLVLMLGLAVFAIIFAINSAIHSYLVLAYTDRDSVALNVGFYYMANAGGRLLGTLASGIIFQIAGFTACLWCSTAMVLAAAFLSLPLTRGRAVSLESASGVERE